VQVVAAQAGINLMPDDLQNAVWLLLTIDHDGLAFGMVFSQPVFKLFFIRCSL
jgi:hypothetical protein